MRVLSALILGGVLCLGCPAPQAPPTNPVGTPTDPDADGSEGVTDEITTDPESDAPKKALVGGYASAEVGSADVVSAADRAIALLQEQSGDKSIALKSIKAAEKQVVAGMNYRMTLELTTSSGAKEVKVKVFRDLEGNYSLLSSEGL